MQQDSPETAALLRRMAEVRADLDDGAQEIAESARDLGEWRHYVRSYPWLCLGVACVVGYLIVPRRRVGPENARQFMAEWIEQRRALGNPPSTLGVLGAVRAVAGNLLWRSAVSFVARRATQAVAAALTSPAKESS
ncbi:MAG: hypothetical protein JNK57_16115 [Planctomycetaceae bacterium]|nr:hypothetical protein [Planctomycetaceae bacterium]